MDVVKEKATELMRGSSPDDLQHGFRQWKIRMEQCRNRGGQYIEEADNIATV